MIALSYNDYKRIQSIDSRESYAYGTKKDLIRKKEEIKCDNIIEQHKNDYKMMLQKKTHTNIIQTDCRFLIHIEY